MARQSKKFSRLYPLKKVNAEGVDNFKRALLCHYSAPRRDLPEEFSLETLNALLGEVSDLRREVLIRYYGLVDGRAAKSAVIAQAVGETVSRVGVLREAGLVRTWRVLNVRLAKRLWEAATSEAERRAVPIDVLDLETRTYHALMREDIKTIGQLIEKPRKDLQDVRQFGQGSWDEVQLALKPLGLRLRQS